ncbi:MAG: ABC transporter ATP-binding protein [Halanaerobium sp.]|nr:ABC transporter ATP-binding protein [Halanaerobium sp.]
MQKNNMKEHVQKQMILEVQNLRKAFGQKVAVADVNLQVTRGDVFGFLGPNGAGKTTTIKMILDLVHKDEGKVKIAGHDIDRHFMQAIRKVGAVVETPRFYEYLTGQRNLALIANLHPEIKPARVDDVLATVGLAARAHERVKNYSLGMKQRLGIARALLNDPDLLILDEPTNGLDPQGMKEVRELVKRLAVEEGITFFISTHLLNEVEQICNRVAILQEGRVITSGSVSSLLDRSKETVEVVAGDKGRLREALANFPEVTVLADTERGVKVDMEKGSACRLNVFLVGQEIPVEYIIPRNQSLEEVFIEITEGGKKVG